MQGITKKQQQRGARQGVGMSNWRRCLAAASLAVGAALAGPAAQAGVIDFEGQAPGFLMDGDSVAHGGYRFTAAYGGDPADGGGLVGAVVDGSDMGLCANFSCPINNTSTFLGAFDDGVVTMRAGDASPFYLAGFDAAFFGHDLLGDGYVAGLLQLTGVRADGSQLDAVFDLFDPLYGFQHYLTDGEFAASAFVSIQFRGYACDLSGFCHPSEANQGQFALDDVVASADAPPSGDVPEPGTALLVGLGCALLRAGRRRRSA